MRVAFLVYRGNPRCGGQGVYTRHLTRELSRLGHEVTVLSGQPYPELDEGVELVEVPSLDLYREPDPFRIPRPTELRRPIDLAEVAVMCSGGFPEPWTFSVRARRALADLARRGRGFDVVHDNQSLGSGLLRMIADGWPRVATIHHPITVDRELELIHADGFLRRLAVRRWYGFVSMQRRVARRLPRVLTVSESSRRDLAVHLGVDPARVAVVPVGVDPLVFRPLQATRPVRGRIMTTASADVPMKGLVPLLEALAKARTEQPHAHLVVVGRLKTNSGVPAVLERLGLEGAVSFVSGVSDERIVELYGESELAVVPSLYEGFSLPAIEAMACGVPLVATTGGAIPEVVGPDGTAALVVRPNDVGALAAGIVRLLAEPALRRRLGAAGRVRASSRFSWETTARLTEEQYRIGIEESRAKNAAGKC
jgi:glycosyltransferase involved in cell wall biosynthesis